MRRCVLVRALWVLPLVLSAVPLGVAQTDRGAGEPSATAIISGRVLTREGRPLPRAQIDLRGERFRLGTFTDAQGRYELTNVPAATAPCGSAACGTFTITASKPGYVAIAYGQRHPSQQARRIELSPGTALRSLDIRLPRGGAIEGRVLDVFGDPVEAVVRVLERRFMEGRWQLQPVAAAQPRFTDDRGRYRLHGLPSGEYFVIATPAERASAAGAPRTAGVNAAYYPGTQDVANARALHLGVSQEVHGADVALVAEPGVTVSGRALTTAGRPLRGRVTLVTSQRSGAAAAVSTHAFVNADGSFEIPDVPPGQYVLQAAEARTGTVTAEGEFGAVFLSVARQDVSGVVLRTSAGSTARGHIVLEGSPQGLTPGDVHVVASPVDLDLWPVAGLGPVGPFPARIADDWTFELPGLHGPRMLALRRAPPGWWLRAVSVDGADATDEPVTFAAGPEPVRQVVIQLANDGASLSGTVADVRRNAARDFTVIVFPAQRQHWIRDSRFVKMARPDSEGAFVVESLPPAVYFAAAVDGVEGTDQGGEWQEARFLDWLEPHATVVTLGSRQHLAVRLSLIERHP